MTMVAAKIATGWPHSRASRLAAVGLFLAAAAGLGVIGQWRSTHMVLINTTQSLPNWAFLIRRGAMPKRGDYVFFAAPRTPLIARHFGMQRRIFGKIAYGLPGDLISHVGALVRINGLRVGKMKPSTRQGERLTPGPIGRIPDRCFYVGTPHPDGFDSRYGDIGLVCMPQILGTGTAVL